MGIRAVPRRPRLGSASGWVGDMEVADRSPILTHPCNGQKPVNGSARINNMDRVSPEAVKDLPNLVRAGSFSLNRLLSHIDPGTAEESEAFVRFIYEQRCTDVSTERNGRIGR